MATLSGGPFIFNLGHGILPDTPIAHVEQMLKRVADDGEELGAMRCRGSLHALLGRPQVRRVPMYLWLKALHIIAVISWMAGMLYLPRLFVYHTAATPGSEQSETFKVMERRLLKFIMTPAMIVTWLVGIVLVLETSAFAAGWFQVQIRAGPRHDRHARPDRRIGCAISASTATGARQKFYRIVNEIPTMLDDRSS